MHDSHALIMLIVINFNSSHIEMDVKILDKLYQLLLMSIIIILNIIFIFKNM